MGSEYYYYTKVLDRLTDCINEVVAITNVN